MSGTTSISGLGSGMDISGLIDSLVQLEATQQKTLQTKVTNYQSKVSIYQSLNTKFSAIKSAADALNLGLEWKLNKATSSDSSVTATANSNAISGSLSFVVKQLASAQVSASFGSVASTDTVVGTGSLLLGQTGALGIKNITGSGLTLGAHEIKVTTASTGASANGSPIADSITLNGTETLNVNIGGSPQSIQLAAGTYTQSSLAEMIGTASGGTLSATVNADRSLKISTTQEGSAASLQVTGGTGLGALGLSAGGVTNGTNGVVEVDGVANTVTNTGGSVVLNGSAGTVTATFSGGLRTGTANVKNIDLGDGKLSTVVSNINAANIGVNAAAVMVAPNQYKLQLQSTGAGSAGAIGTDFNAFSGTLGSLDTITAAKNAILQVGSGAGAYNITSSSNSIVDALPGVTLNVTSADPNKTVTVNVGGDAAGLADKVQSMVTAVNDALSFIKINSAYDAAAKKGGPLLGDSTAQRLQSQLVQAMSDIVSGSTLQGMGSVGLTLSQDGNIAFDKNKFTTAYNADPQSVVSLFVEGGLTGPSTGTLPGIVERLMTVSSKAVDSVSGAITTAIKGQNSTIDRLNDQIDQWDLRLEKYRARLVAQFTAMDTAVAQYRNMGTWLSGQIGGLITNYSS